MSLTRTWAPYFISKIRERGGEYQRDGRVTQVAAEEGELLRAEVRGEEPYSVVVESGEGAAARCTCPYFAKGSYCKHIWAAIVDFDRQRHADVDEDGEEDEAGGAGAGGDSLVRSSAPVGREVSGGAGVSIDAGIPALPKARKRTGPRAPMRPRQPLWMTQLSVLRLNSGDREGLVGIGGDEARVRRIYYVLQPHASNRRGAVVLKLAQRTPRRGGWGQLKRLRVGREDLKENAGLFEDADREIIATLLGAGAVEEEDDGRSSSSALRPYAFFQLPVGAQRSVLRRMIETGRCLMELSIGRPFALSWQGEEPWRLWTVGREDTDGGLAVTLELRRGEETLAIDEPAVIVPGPDGLIILHDEVSAFDDGGAGRWVRQYREESDDLGEAHSMRIEAGEIDAFLERLYQLPTLPMLDLPDGVAWPIERVQPTPRLDIFGSRAGGVGGAVSESGGSGGSGGGTGMVEAVCYFDYGGHSVTPGQSHRFLVPLVEMPEDDGVAGDGGEVAPTPIEPEDAAVKRPIIERDLGLERRALAFLEMLGFSPMRDGDGDRFSLSAKQLPRAVDVLTRWGWVVRADRRVVHQPSTPRLSVVSGVDWFELRGAVAFETATGIEEVSLPEVLAAAREGRGMITLGDGSQGLLPQQWLSEHGLLAAVATAQDDHLRFKASQAALLDALLSETQQVEVDERFAEARKRLHEFDGVSPIEAGPKFQGELRPYQQDGLGWLSFLRRFMMGGVLADDMGLGKTIQVLAMIDRRHDEVKALDAGDADAVRRPSLIVVPRSVVFNWLDEAERFTPRLRVVAYTGPDRHGLRESFAESDLIITSYGLLRRDIEELRQCPFHYIVLDEAQAIKNPQSQAAKAARLLDAEHRLALTGTPVENHLGDLWSIFEFLNPGVLGSSTRFGDLIRQTGGGGSPRGGRPRAEDGEGWQQFAAPPGVGAVAPDLSAIVPSDEVASGAKAKAVVVPTGPKHLHAEEAASLVGKALKPFILRRTKKQVLDELPEKTEQTILCQMEPAQRKVYQDLVKYYRGTLLQKLEASGPAGGSAFASGAGGGGGGAGGGSAMMVLEALLRLRQAACHPALIDKEKESKAPSAKLDVLMERVGDLIDEGHKALVFSQFTSFLSLARERLDEREIPYEYLDGQTRNRRDRIERFQTDPDCPLFLISLKAGGLGLNLTAASYVFILDPWWNPAVESQAIDRAHRIGQTQHVFAYRLICEGTVEQRIIELQNKKRQLADAIVGGQESVIRSLTREDLESLLS